MKKMVYASLLIIYFKGILPAQNYFPLDAGYLNCVRVQAATHCHGGIFYNTDIYQNGGVIKDTIIQDKTFHEFRFGNKVRLLYYDHEAQRLYIRLPSEKGDTIVKAFNFELDVGEKDTSWFNAVYAYGSYGSVLRLVTKSVININFIEKLYIEYEDVSERKVKFVEDIGLIENDYWDFHQVICDYEVKETLISTIYDSMIYNPIELWIESTNLMTDIPINLFPYNFKVNFSSWSQPIQLDTFQVEVNLIRNDSVIFSSINEIEKDSFSVIILLDSSILKVNDTIAYGVYVTDSSIFNNKEYFPYYESGYKKIKILNPITHIREQRNNPNGFFISQNYPNPFNPNTTIEYL